MPFSDPVRTLIDELIESQHRLDTPVARFATAHDTGFAPRSQLIPLTAPGPGEQYAFQVDLDSCSGCKACVAGCHSLNGLDENETWRDVGLVLGSHSEGGTTSVSSVSVPSAFGSSAPLPSAYQQTITTACHHCEDPACLSGCPVLAYEKDPITGIAPFRAFLHERAAAKASGKNWLFFGDQKAATDFLYQDELTSLATAGTLTRLDVAFSRDQTEKIYVQTKMLAAAAELYAWLEAGAFFYVCGDASRMAKDVDAALHKVVELAGQKSPAEAAAYIQSLKTAKRYQRDVY